MLPIKETTNAGKEMADPNFWNALLEKSTDILFSFGMTLIYAIIALVIGLFVIKILMRIVKKMLDKGKVDLSLRSFLLSMASIILYVALFFIIALIFGVKSATFIGIFGAAGIAIGLALQGSLANFAGGVLILVFKPFRVGDKVIINGKFGVVEEIDILYTRLKSYRGFYFIMPNGNVANTVVENRALSPELRVQVELRFSFEEDVDQLREIITSTMAKHPKLVEGKPVQFWVSSMDEYNIKTSARCWAKTWDLWEVYWDQIEAIKKALEAHNIKFAIPKTEVRYPDGINENAENKN